MEYMIISVPFDKKNQSFTSVYKELFIQNNLCNVCPFTVPVELRVGTIDILISLSEKLSKLDSLGNVLTSKIFEEWQKVSSKNPIANLNSSINNESVQKLISNFRWDDCKFSKRDPLEKMYENLSKRIIDIHESFKKRSETFKQLNIELEVSYNKESSKSFLTKNLASVVKKEHFVLDSEYLVTLIVVVPKDRYKSWKLQYEVLVDFVVPRSSELIAEDQEFGLWNVTIFRRQVSEFTEKAKEMKFTVRDFTFDQNTIDRFHSEKERLVGQVQSESKMFSMWLRVNFEETLNLVLHVKSIQIFIESVLRYGLPVNFQSILIGPWHKNQKKIENRLSKIFSHLDQLNLSNMAGKEEEKKLDFFLDQEYFPYVYSKIELKFLNKH